MGVGIEIKEIMHKAVITIKPTDTIYKVAQTMAKTDVGGLVAIEGGEIKGMITEGDIIKEIVAEGKDPKQVKVSEIMKTPVKTVKKDTDLEKSLEIMRDLDIERLPIVNEEDKLIGIVTERDMTQVEPGLIDLMREKEAVTAMERISKSDIEITGTCEECDNYSNRLREYNGKLLCETCRESEF